MGQYEDIRITKPQLSNALHAAVVDIAQQLGVDNVEAVAHIAGWYGLKAEDKHGPAIEQALADLGLEPPAKPTVEEQAGMVLTPASLDLFLSLVEDAPNWSGQPLVDGLSAAGRGNLTDLKVKGLIQTAVEEDGCVFALFTEAGLALAAEHGHDLSWIREWPGVAS